jgi:Uma2 family endonuclease
MSTIVLGQESVRIPPWVQDLESFHRWVESDEFPEKVRVCYLNGEAWIDMSKEQFYSHNKVKGEFAFVLLGLVKAGRLGEYLHDGMLVTNVEVEFSSGPDGAFVSRDTLDMGRARFVEGRKEGFVELEGTPDMVLEIVSDSSVQKDNVDLRDLYSKAGIPEYWLVDVRGERVLFDILRHTAKGYVAARKQGGWLKSGVFGKSFRLVSKIDERDNPEYVLEVK